MAGFVVSRARERPFHIAKSSDSSGEAGDAAQLILTSGPNLRGLRLWIACTINSLPLPLGPMTSTLQSDLAIFGSTSIVRFIAGLPVTIPVAAYCTGRGRTNPGRGRTRPTDDLAIGSQTVAVITNHLLHAIATDHVDPGGVDLLVVPDAAHSAHWRWQTLIRRSS